MEEEFMLKEHVCWRTRTAFMSALCAVALILVFVIPSTASAAPTNSAFVQKAYLDLLLRPASPSDISTWTPLLDTTLTRTQFALDVMASPEYLRVRGNEFYNDFLSRSPSPSEAAILTNFLQTNTLPQGRASILGSPEYFTTQGGGSNAGFLNALYLDLLNRPIDPTASVFYQGQLTGGATRSDIAMAVQGGDEWRTDIVTDYYQQFLHHAPDSFGLTFYKGVLSGGGTEQDVIAALLGSEEYFQNVPEPAAISLLALGLIVLRRRRR
jgi:hypothetical protein